MPVNRKYSRCFSTAAFPKCERSSKCRKKAGAALAQPQQGLALAARLLLGAARRGGRDGHAQGGDEAAAVHGTLLSGS
jgi:hypothetical protein